MAMLLVVGKVLSVWVLPVVIVGGLLLVTVVGAFQLRHDAKLSEKGFVSLMALTLKQLPLFSKLTAGGPRAEAERPMGQG
jgi:hypothetical protein